MRDCFHKLMSLEVIRIFSQKSVDFGTPIWGASAHQIHFMSWCAIFSLNICLDS
jgi:hypothetical protein